MTRDLLSTRQQQDTAAWSAVLARARTQWPDQELDELIERTVTDIRHTVGNKRAAFAWSGSTDCLVLGYVAGLAGIDRCVLTITDLEYPAFLRWITDCMPDGLTVVSTGQDLRWLREHPQMLLLGPRRRINGNYSYGPSKELTWRERSGLTRYTPLIDWSAEAMLALIQREQIPLPPGNSWPRGSQLAPGPWPARRGTTSTCHGFEEVWSIDADIIRAAAPQLPQAARWLESTGRS